VSWFVALGLGGAIVCGVVTLFQLAALVNWAMARRGNDNSDGEDGL